METKEIVEHMLSAILDRKEILKIPYCRGDEKGKKIESWINTEMLAKLLDFNQKNQIEQVEGEHKYHIQKKSKSRKRRFPRSDFWWNIDNQEHWLEVKTFRLHSNTNGLRYKDKKKIDDDLERMIYLRTPYIFHHLLFVFDDNDYKNGDWMEDVHSVYKNNDMDIEAKWKSEIDRGKNLHIFLHTTHF